MTLEEARQQLAVLRRATNSVELGPFGAAAVVTDACRAFRALAADRETLAQLEPDVVGVVRDGSPAAIVYAALLLRGLGRDVAPLLEPYRDDRRECTVFPGGCTGIKQSLAEAARWATYSTPPGRLMPPTTFQLDTIARATWFELPSAAVLAAGPTGRPTGRYPQGVWVLSFAELLFVPSQLATTRAELEALLGHAEPQVRLYAALLLRAFDRPAGERALAALAAGGGKVERLQPGFLNKRRTRAVPIAEVIAELAAWP
jgi:hypothetical protein